MTRMLWMIFFFNRYCLKKKHLTLTSAHRQQGHAAMEPIVAAARTMLESSTGLIQTARSLAVNPKDPPKWSVLAGHSRTVSDSIKKLITNMRYQSLCKKSLVLRCCCLHSALNCSETVLFAVLAEKRLLARGNATTPLRCSTPAFEKLIRRPWLPSASSSHPGRTFPWR